MDYMDIITRSNARRHLLDDTPEKTPVSLKPIPKYHRKIIVSDSQIIICNTRGISRTFRVPNNETLDQPRGMMFTAIESCDRYLPAFDGFGNLFMQNLAGMPEDALVVLKTSIQLYERSRMFNVNNPGHILLAIRPISGAGVCYVTTAYIRTLAEKLGMGNDANSYNMEKLVFVHAGICKILGSAYCAPIITMAKNQTGVDALDILFELLIHASKDVIGSVAIKLDERKAHIKQLRWWHAPKYAREWNEEGKRWSFDRPLERAEAINNCLNV